MSSGRTRGMLAGALPAGAMLAHALPSVTALRPVRRRVAPSLERWGGRTSVALTFDDGPADATSAVLDRLAAAGARATFFVLGDRVAADPEPVRRAAAEGHELAVHGWTHRPRLLLPPPTAYDELARTADLLTRYAGRRPGWYRPPYGVLAAADLVAARRLGLRIALWGACGRDWDAGATGDSVLRTLAATGWGPGATLLLHDPRPAALAALPGLLTGCAERGLAVVPLGEHLA